MKLNEEECRIMVNLEYEKAQSFLEQTEKIASMDLWDVVANRLRQAYSRQMIPNYTQTSR